MNEKLLAIRQKIDHIDHDIQRLLNERAQCAHEVGLIKSAEKAEAEASFYRPEREADILRRIKEANTGPLDDETMVQLFRSIISACLALEKPLTIAILGPHSTFSHHAALKHFGPSMRPTFLNTIRNVFQEVEAKRANYGVIPIENSTEGIVNHALDMFIHSKLNIIGEVILAIHHQLLSKAAKNDIVRIYSHQQAFAQCRQWLDENYPQAELVAVASTAHAAQIASEEKNAAAIASLMAAETYHLNILAENIEDAHANSTRFLVIGHRAPPPSGDDKSSLALSIPHKPGALANLLSPFAKHNINITLLESRPSHSEIWNYVFFLDVTAHQENSALPQVLQELTDSGVAVKCLGSYPKAIV